MAESAVVTPKPPLHASHSRETPFQESLRQHAAAASAFLIRTTAVTHQHGAADYYSRPLRPPFGWTGPSVVATSALVTSGLGYGRLQPDPILSDRAIGQASWLLGTQLPDGAFPGGELRRQESPSRSVWSTANATSALLAAYTSTGDQRFLESATAAGRWLARGVNLPVRMWTQYTEHPHASPAFYTRVCAAMLQLWQQVQEPVLQANAVLVLDRILQDQEDLGGFRTWAESLRDSADLYHIALLIEGLFISAAVLGPAGSKYQRAADRMATTLAQHRLTRARLGGSYDENWEPDTGYKCLPGEALLVDIWLKAYQDCNRLHYLNAAMHCMQDLLELQELAPMDPECTGAIGGSHPLWGAHDPMRYPTYATALFLNAAVGCHAMIERLLEEGPCVTS